MLNVLGPGVEKRQVLRVGWAVCAGVLGFWLGVEPMVGPVAGAQAAPTAVASAFAEVAGARLHYTDTGGSGATVVFMHARTGSVLMWEHQRQAFSGAGYRFIAYDRLGHGRSETRPPGSQPGAAADDLDALMDYLRVDRFHLVGTAAGGIVSIDYALSSPRRLRSLVVANSIGGVQDDDYLAMSRRLRPSPQFEALPADFRELGPSYRAGNAAGTARWIELEELSRARVPLTTPQRTSRRITWSALEGITVPTLLLTGDGDLYTPPAVLRLFAARIKGSESVVLPEAGHSAYWEQPALFNRAVLDFIGRH
jgi:pimeloyl-ACP methyl ester carboxylesterase